MHIILGILGAIVTILILLHRLANAGIDLGGLNPFLWRRRRRWQKQFEGNPIYQIDNPLELAALLATATVKLDGDMSSTEKSALLKLFQLEFNLSKREAADLLVSSAYLLGTGEEVKNNLEKVIQPSLEHFTPEQSESALELLGALCNVDPTNNALKVQFVEAIKNIFQQQFAPKGKWD